MEVSVEAPLAQVWRSLALGEVLGMASATAGRRGAVVVVTAAAVGEVEPWASARLADALGVDTVDVVVLRAGALGDLAREWLHQAAQGSGRGVSVQVFEDGDVLRLLVDSLDSSAREVALRLASPHEPALAALTALLPHRAVEVRALS